MCIRIIRFSSLISPYLLDILLSYSCSERTKSLSGTAVQILSILLSCPKSALEWISSTQKNEEPDKFTGTDSVRDGYSGSRTHTGATVCLPEDYNLFTVTGEVSNAHALDLLQADKDLFPPDINFSGIFLRFPVTNRGQTYTRQFGKGFLRQM